MADEEEVEETEEPQPRDYGEQTNADLYVGVNPEYQTAAYDVDAPVEHDINVVEQAVMDKEEAVVSDAVTGLGPAVGVDPIPLPGEEEEEDDEGQSLTKQALLVKAQQLGIEGRSGMSKDELAEAVADAEEERNAGVVASKQRI